jgi:hypothetical protein
MHSRYPRVSEAYFAMDTPDMMPVPAHLSRQPAARAEA